MVPETTKPLVVPKGPFKGRESSKDLEIVLATLPIFAKEDSKSKGQTSIATEATKPNKGIEKEKPPLKIN